MKEYRSAVIFTLVFMLFFSLLYFSLGYYKIGDMQKDTAIFKDIKVKVAYNEEGVPKIFALAENNELAKYKAYGNSIPESDSMVIGNEEAKMMIDEKLFSKPGDNIKGLFGIDTKVEGILDKTGTIMDDMHFLSFNQFNSIKGEDNRIFFRISDEDVEVYYLYRQNEQIPLNLSLTEGNLGWYKISEVGGVTYYPLILGSYEAKMMKEEGEFTKIQDQIEIDGKRFILVGILKETDTSMDMMHIIPIKL